MCEILFRGKRLDNNEWVEGFYAYIECDNRHVIIAQDTYTEYGGLYYFTVDIDTVGQYIGLTDKNGKKIFEGDIVHCVSMTDMANMVVIFEYGEFRMVLCENYKDYIPGCGFYAIRCFDKEVLGNIHDNPELLENP